VFHCRAVVLVTLLLASACGVEAEEAVLEEELATAEAAVTAAAASGWTWQYLAIVGSETYRLSKNGELRGICTAKSSGVITLKDADADGLGQRVYWRVEGGTWRVCDNEGGDGSSKNCDVPNDRWIQYQFCMKDGNRVIACAPQDGFRS